MHHDRTQSSLRDCYLVTDLAQRALRLGDGTTLTIGAPNYRDIVTKYLAACRKVGITEGNNERSRTDSDRRISAFIQKSFAGAH